MKGRSRKPGDPRDTVKKTAIIPPHPTDYQWLHTGAEALAEMLAAIAAATRSIRLEMYIFEPSPSADQYREALVAAAQRGVRVQVLLDAFGSMALPAGYWDGLRAAGGESRLFNPESLNRFGIRDHRKLLVCDDSLAFIGGFNIAAEYHGDGIISGWCDLGLKIRGHLVAELAVAADEMFAAANFRHHRFFRLRKSGRQRTISFSGGKLILTGPGRNNAIKTALSHDLKHARRVSLICAYFLPPRSLRRQLCRLARRGVKVQLILPGKSDVLLSLLAARSLYRRLLTAGVEIYEYQPQILHAKLFLVDDVVYAGSSNLDARSLTINYELMLRVPDAQHASNARAIFHRILGQCRRIELTEWRRSRTFWDRLKGRFARWLLSRVDPYIAGKFS